MTRFWRSLGLALILMLRSASRRVRQPSAQDSGRLKVVATFSILGDVVQNVAGDNVDLTVIVGPDGDAHTFEPKPDQIASLGRCQPDLRERNRLRDLAGRHVLGVWLLGEASRGNRWPAAARIQRACRCSRPLPHTSDDGHDHGEHDPHVWQDVSNVDRGGRRDPGCTDCGRSRPCRCLHRQCGGLHHAATGAGRADQADGRDTAGREAGPRHLARFARLLRPRLRLHDRRDRARLALDRGGRSLGRRHRAS